MAERFTLTVDGRAVEAEEGQTILEVLRAQNVDTPTVCRHDAMAPAEACRVCVVEVAGIRPLVASCERRAEAGMAVLTESPRVRRARRGVFELLLGDRDLSAAPEILDQAERAGAVPGRYPARRESARPSEMNSLFVRDDDRCILCDRCVQVCSEEVQNVFAIALAGRGTTTRISSGYTPALEDSVCVFCGNCVAACPTGALMDRSEFNRREEGRWRGEDLKVVQTTCPYCGVGCQLELHVDVGENAVVKVTSPEDHSVGHGNLCVKGRYGYAFLQAGRTEGRSG